MRLSLIITLFVLLTLSCKAQHPVVGLTEMKGSIPNGIYYKDIDGDLDKYIGTWKYANGNTSLTIKLKKIVQYYNGKWYEDKLVGNYIFIQNGIVVMNYLFRLNDSNVNVAQHYIKGNRIIFPNQVTDCDGCAHMERRIELIFSDPERTYFTEWLVLRHQIINGVEKI